MSAQTMTSPPNVEAQNTQNTPAATDFASICQAMSLQQQFLGLDMEEFEELCFAFKENAVAPDDKPQAAKVNGTLMEPILRSLHYHFDRRSIQEATAQVALASNPSPVDDSTPSGKNSKAPEHLAAFSLHKRQKVQDASWHSAQGGEFGHSFAQTYEAKCGKSTELSLEQFVQVVVILRAGNQKEKETSLQRRFPFDPDSFSKQGWDVMIMMLLLYTTFSIPFLLAFDKEFSVPLDAYNTFELIVDCTFCLDIIINFCTAYTDRGIYVTDMRQIAIHYCKSWFTIDFLGSVPFDKIAYAIVVSGSSANDLGSMGAMRILKIIRVFKMVRVLRFLDKLKQLEQKDGFTFLRPFIRVFRSVFLLTFTAHFVGCIFVMLLAENDEWNWLRAYDESLFEEGDFTQYTVALYWAMISVSTMGYGDIKPVTHEERVFTVFVAIAGTVVFSVCMGNLASLISAQTGVLWRFDEKLQVVNEWLEWRRMPLQLKRRVRGFYGACWRNGGAMFREKEVLADLPAETRRLVMQEIAVQATEQLPMVQGLSDECKADVLRAMVQVRFNQQDCVYRRMDEGSDLFIVASGTMVACHQIDLFHEQRPEGRASRTLSDPASLEGMQALSEGEAIPVGGMFGELGLFPELCRYRLESVVAQTVCQCHKMPLEVFRELAAKHPEFAKKMHTLCTLKAHYLCASNEALEAMRAAREAEGSWGFLDSEARKLRTKIAERQQERLMLVAGVAEAKEVHTVWWPRELLQGTELGADNARRAWIKMNVAISADRKLFGRVMHAGDIRDQTPFHLGDLPPGGRCRQRGAAHADEFSLGTAVVDFEMCVAAFGPQRLGEPNDLPRRRIRVGLRDGACAEALHAAILQGAGESSPGHNDNDNAAAPGTGGVPDPATQSAQHRTAGESGAENEGRPGAPPQPSRAGPASGRSSGIVDGTEALPPHTPRGASVARGASSERSFAPPPAAAMAQHLARAMEPDPGTASSGRGGPAVVEAAAEPEASSREAARAAGGAGAPAAGVQRGGIGAPLGVEELEVPGAPARSNMSDVTFQA